MSEVWRETWQVEPDSTGMYQNLVVAQEGPEILIAQCSVGGDEDDARAKLAAQAPEMARILREICTVYRQQFHPEFLARLRRTLDKAGIDLP